MAGEINLSQYASNIGLNNWQYHNLKGFDRRFCTDRDKVIFDDELLKVLRKYVRDQRHLDEVVDYLANLTDSDGNLYSQSLKQYKKIAKVITNFKSEDRPSLKGSEVFEKSVATLKADFPSKSLNALVYNSDVDIKTNLPKSDAHSGMEFILTGKKYKGEYMEGIQKAYVLEEQKAIENGSFGKLILPGVRTQGSGAFDESDGSFTYSCEHKTRMINMVDLYQVLCEMKYSKPIQDFMSLQPWYAGGKDDTEISRLFSDWRSKYRYCLSIDYSGYDQTVPAWLIQVCFDIIKDCFRSVGPEFDVIAHDFIHKDILYDGIVYSIDKGVPSGSMFTQIVDSMANRLAITTFFNLLGVNNYRMCIMGDDNIIFFNDFFDVKGLSSFLSRRFGLKYNIKKSDPIYSTREHHPHFLSKFYTWKGPDRNENVILARMLYPESYRRYYDVSNYVKPEHVILGYIYAYPVGMERLIDVEKFLLDNPNFSDRMLEYLDTTYLPGSLAYSIVYVDKRRRQTVGRRRSLH